MWLVADNRPITFADLDRHTIAIISGINELGRQVRSLDESMTRQEADVVRHGERLSQHGTHLTEIQRKLDHAGVDGTRRLGESGVTTSQAVSFGTLLLAFVASVAGGVAWLFEHFKVR